MSKLNTLLYIIKHEGLGSVFKILYSRLFPKTISQFETIKIALSNRKGIEIGGPSWIFKDYNYLPIYKLIGSLDGCNFSQNTIWEGEIEKNSTYQYYRNKQGKQFILEASNLSIIQNETYDFVISSHCLEHIANPMKAIEEWLRVIKHNGHFLIVVPNKEKTFDHNRAITDFKHIMADYENNTSENDLTHLEEILSLHDLNMDPKAGGYEQFKQRSLSNSTIRALHHHVFDTMLLRTMLNKFNTEIIFSYTCEDHVIFGKKK